MTKDPFGPIGQSRGAKKQRYAQQRRTAGLRREKTPGYEGMNVVVRVPRPFRVGERSAHFDTLFANFIDVVTDPSRARAKDPDVNNRMRQDLQVLGCLKVRQLATSQLTRRWIPASQNSKEKIASGRFEKWFGGQYRLTDAVMNMLDAILDGISIQEIVWGLNEEDFSYGIKRMFPCFKDRFVFSKDGRLCLRTRGNVFYGEYVHPWQFIKHVYNAGGGSWTNPSDEARLYWGQGLEDNIYPTYFFKTVVLNFYTRWLQRLSGGVLVARYPWKNADAAEVVTELIEAYQEDEELAFPSGDEWNVEIMEGTRAAPSTYLEFIEYCDRQISKALLGSTLIIDAGDVGTQSLGKVHERTTFGRLCEFDRLGLEETVNHDIVPIIGELNQVQRQLWPTFAFSIDQKQDAADVISALGGLQALGFDISAELVAEETGFRQPRPGETILEAKPDALGGFDLLGGKMKTGERGLSNLDLSTPKGINKFRSLVYGLTHGRGVQRYDLASATDEHSHSAEIDKFGNGEADGTDSKRYAVHGHEIRTWRVSEERGHTHELVVKKVDMAQVLAALTSA